MDDKRAVKIVELHDPEKNLQLTIKFMGANSRCPYLNKNDYCVITRAGAGCRMEFCTSERHSICGDYQKAEEWAATL